MAMGVLKGYGIDRGIFDRAGEVDIALAVGFGVIHAVESIGITAAHMDGSHNAGRTLVKSTLEINILSCKPRRIFLIAW